VAKKRRRTYPTTKPHPGFPLTPRKDGRFTKRIRGQEHVFGRRGDWRTALDEYLAKARALHAGRMPAEPVAVASSVTVRQLVNRYLDERRKDMEAGQLHARTWADYRTHLLSFARFVGPAAPAGELGTSHVDGYATHLRNTMKTGPRRFNSARAHLFAFLRHCFAAPWIPRFELGVGFKRAPKGQMREARKSRLILPRHLKLLISIADPQMRAMILLGINGGFGNTDCANLPRAAVDLHAKVIRFARVKTKITRTVPLFDETADALAIVLAQRPADALVFRTRHGNMWVRTTFNANGKPVPKDSISQAFSDLLESVCDLESRDSLRNIYKGAGFYSLRHTFITYANEVRDSDARRHITGRRLTGVEDDYVESFFLPRLRVVVDHVRTRAFALDGSSSK
jgi:site-specific recombinase XerD